MTIVVEARYTTIVRASTSLLVLSLFGPAAAGCDGGKTSDDAKPEATAAKDSPSDPEPEAAGSKTAGSKTAAPAPPPKSLKYRKGQTAPGGMTEAEMQEYAEAQGDPMKGVFTLEQAFEGDATLADPTQGKLTATVTTSLGAFECELFEEQTPVTVANFVGLSRGTRPWYDKKTDRWVEDEPYYADLIWHRVMKDFMAQTGDRSGSGSGGPGYVIADEIDPKKLKHRWKGTLSMANRELPNTGNSQFFVTVKPTPHLNGKHAVFGKCDPSVAKKISQVKVNPARNNRPYDPVRLESISIRRK